VAPPPIDRDPPVRRLRWFAGFWLPLFLGLVGLVVLRATGSVPLAVPAWAAAAGSALGGWLRPARMRWLWVAWMTATWPLAFVATRVLLALVFFLVVTPVGLAVRAFAGDPLRRRPDPSAPTYWDEKEPVGSIERYFRQF
jgi:hypothetical protein